VYITTNGEVEEITSDETVTFEAHVTGGGTPPYTYEWATKREGAPDWKKVGGDTDSWTWNPGNLDAGTQDVRCRVTDAQARTGEVIFEGFVITNSCPVVQLYGESSEQVQFLRNFRDRVLKETLEGQQLIKLYYAWSPVLARAIDNDDAFREEITEAIEGIVSVVKGTRE